MRVVRQKPPNGGFCVGKRELADASMPGDAQGSPNHLRVDPDAFEFCE